MSQEWNSQASTKRYALLSHFSVIIWYLLSILKMSEISLSSKYVKHITVSDVWLLWPIEIYQLIIWIKLQHKSYRSRSPENFKLLFTQIRVRMTILWRKYELCVGQLFLSADARVVRASALGSVWLHSAVTSNWHISTLECPISTYDHFSESS
jgi:hypothetical protein